jgi:hypothetical protein
MTNLSVDGAEAKLLLAELEYFVRTTGNLAP